MRRAFRHVLVWAVAVALVGGGAAWQPCASLQRADATAGIDHGAHAVSHHATTAASHDHNGTHHDHGAPSAPVAPTIDDHACMKCCAMCTMATLVPLAGAAAVPFAISSAVIYRPSRTPPYNAIAVDPGIPKRIG
jgi:hypothetical protein